MKKIHCYLVIITLAFAGLSCKHHSQVILRFFNSLETERTGEVITIENKLLTNLTGAIGVERNGKLFRIGDHGNGSFERL